MVLAFPAHGAAPRWCQARGTLGLTGRVVSLSLHASVLPIAGAGDGRSFFAQLYSPAFSGVVRIDARTSRVTRIRRFPSAHDDQADGSFEGRWLVWNEYHSLSDFNDFTVFAWDSRTHRVTQLGAAKGWASGWRQPDVRGGLATWTQGSGPDGEAEVHVYDLRRSTDRIVHRGHPQGSFFVSGPTVVWPESTTRGAATRMLAANPRTGSRVSPPPALAGLRGVSALFTDGTAIAYPSSRFTSLWWAPSLLARPQLVFEPKRQFRYLDNSVRVAGRYFLFSSEREAFVGDGRTHRYLLLRGDGVAIDRRALIVSSWTKGKSLHPRNRITFVPLRSLQPLGPC